MQADKSICLKGNVQNGPIIYRPYPVNEFTVGNWQIAVSSVSFDSTATLSTTCAVASNFSTSKKRNQKGEINVYQMPLAVFHLKTSSSTPRSVFRFSPIFFPMNALGDELRLSLVDTFQEDDVPLKFNCEVVIQILFRRV